eukprot:7882925-Pyramimonas_sp.AAC.2
MVSASSIPSGPKPTSLGSSRALWAAFFTPIQDPFALFPPDMDADSSTVLCSLRRRSSSLGVFDTSSQMAPSWNSSAWGNGNGNGTVGVAAEPAGARARLQRARTTTAVNDFLRLVLTMGIY